MLGRTSFLVHIFPHLCLFLYDKFLQMELLSQRILPFYGFWHMYRVSKSRSVVSDSLWSHGLYSPWNSPGQNTGVGSLSLLQGIFPSKGSNPGLPHCRRILYQLRYQGSPICAKWPLKKTFYQFSLPSVVCVWVFVLWYSLDIIL